MEQKNKYYTPSIEDIHLGYEMEWLQKACPDCLDGVDVDTWFKYDYNFQGLPAKALPYLIADKKLRTKYLDQSDIESCGWEIDVEKEKRRKNHVTAPYISKGKNGMLSQHGENYMISTIIGPPTEDSYGGIGQPMYMGPIKSINELRTIMKYLNIK